MRAAGEGMAISEHGSKMVKGQGILPQMAQTIPAFYQAFWRVVRPTPTYLCNCVQSRNVIQSYIGGDERWAIRYRL